MEAVAGRPTLLYSRCSHVVSKLAASGQGCFVLQVLALARSLPRANCALPESRFINMNISELILSRGAEHAPAIFYGEIVVTYGKLRREVERIAGMAAKVVSAPGDIHGARIGIFSENSPFFIAAYLGIIQAGRVAVPLQRELRQEVFAKIVREAGIKDIFVSAKSERMIRPWADALACRVHVEEPSWELEPLGYASRDSCGRVMGESAGLNAGIDTDGASKRCHTLGEANGAPREPRNRTKQQEGNDRLAALMFTSGSTGEPKGVMITHRNIECNTHDIIEYMGLTAADRCMVVLPLHYCFGLSLMHTHLMAGGSLVLNNQFALYPETVLREMQTKECTGLAGVPSTYQILLRRSRFRQMSFPTLRWFQQAGGKLPNPCITEILESFPEVRFFLMYGQTEATARLSYLPPECLKSKLGSIGKGLPSTKLEVVKPDGTQVIRRTNSSHTNGDWEVGEIVAEGENVSPGYWNDLEETAKSFRNGRLYTGDLARVDEDGFIFIVERERDMIKSGGNRVSAKEVEDVIAEIPEVVETAVVATPHELLGESICAFVVLHPNATLSEIHVEAHCRKRLPVFKTPEQVIFLKVMPHNSSGKVLKHELKQMARNQTSKDRPALRSLTTPTIRLKGS